MMNNILKISILNVFFTYIIALLLPAAVFAQVEQIWALGDGEKIFREDLNHPDKNGNHVWDGETLHLKGLFNEVMAFQVIAETGPEGADALEISIEAPVNRRSGKSIGGNTLKYGPGGTIEIFTQHYLHVENPTQPQWFYGSSAAAPEHMTGWIPDALIPVNATPGRGGFPVDVGPSRNQGFWVDLHLPRDQDNYPSGIYHGMIQVLQSGEMVKEIPLEVTLLDEYLTDENHTNIWLYTSNVQAYYPELSRQRTDEMLKFEGRRHRIDVVGGFSVNSSSFDEQNMNEYLPWLDGSAYMPGNGYHGPGQGVGEQLFPIGMYGSNVLGSSRGEVRQESNQWVEWFEQNAPEVNFFWYIIDEPGEEQFDWIRERSEWIKGNPGPGSSLPIFTTRGYHEGLEGAIDIWAAYDGVDLELLPGIRSQGGDHWFYNGNRPRYGSVILEGAAVDFRVNSWILYKYDIRTHFIWHGTHWRHNHQGPKGHLHQNIFQNPLTFISDGMNFGNGDGIIYYPGRMPIYGEEDRGLNQILPSIRLKNIRRGQQDAGILWMAEQKAGRDHILEIISHVVPRALSEAAMNEEVPWSENGDDYEQVREQLLQIIVD
jgi:hypothetical protein